MTRRIVGERTFTKADNHREFSDSLGLFSNWRERGPVYECPLSTLYSSKVRNLIVAGRCQSADDPMLEISRVIPYCSVMGEAAGVVQHSPTISPHLTLPRRRRCFVNAVFLFTRASFKNKKRKEPIKRSVLFYIKNENFIRPVFCSEYSISSETVRASSAKATSVKAFSLTASEQRSLSQRSEKPTAIRASLSLFAAVTWRKTKYTSARKRYSSISFGVKAMGVKGIASTNRARFSSFKYSRDAKTEVSAFKAIPYPSAIFESRSR